MSVLDRISKLDKAHVQDSPAKGASPRSRPQYHVGAFGDQANGAARHSASVRPSQSYVTPDAQIDSGYISDTSSTYSSEASYPSKIPSRVPSGLLDLTIRPFCFGFSLAFGIGFGLSVYNMISRMS